MKRLFDIIISFTALIALLPPCGILMLLIFLEDHSNPLFGQTRIGINGREFCLYKLRSMVPNAENLGSHSTSSRDHRITRTGKWIRKASLDELPQLFNVLRGDMSLVGPRPYLPQQKKRFTEEEWKKRHLVRPGITGLAQVNGRSNSTQDERTRNDLYYVDHCSLGFDLGIIGKTVIQLVNDRSNAN